MTVSEEESEGNQWLSSRTSGFLR